MGDEDRGYAEAVREAAETFGKIDVGSLLKMFAAALASKAWEAMGVRLAPGSTDLSKDLAQARLAIDAFAALLGVMEPGLKPDEARSLKGTLADLRVNFVSKESEG